MDRRDLLKTTGSTVGSFVLIPQVVSADTDSGHVETEITATVNSPHTVTVVVNEDLEQDGNATNTQSIDVQDGTNTYTLTDLDGTTETTQDYWTKITLETSDTSTTPELDSLKISVPDVSEAESPDFDFLFPNKLTLELSLLLIGFITVFGWISKRVRSAVGIVSLSMSFITFILSFVIGISFVWVWVMLGVTAIGLTLSSVIQFADI